MSPKLGEVAGVRIVVWLKEHRGLAWAAWNAARRGETFDPGTWR